MKTLSNIKKDLEFGRGLSSLIDVLKNIAVSQYRALERKIKGYKEFPSVVEGFFEFIDASRVRHPFLNPEDKPQGVVAITSDSGLLGGLNMQVVAAAIRELEKIRGKLIVVGERGKIYAQESGLPFVSFGGVKDEERHIQAMQLKDYLVEKTLQGAFGHLKFIYPHPVSFTVQRVETIPVLPFTTAVTKQKPAAETSPEIILESEPADILEYAIGLWMWHRLYEIFGLARLAEFAARYMHLESSLQKLKEMDNKLRLQYFRVRHELIDCNMRELFSARTLYAS